jgi:hypothetical protein
MTEVLSGVSPSAVTYKLTNPVSWEEQLLISTIEVNYFAIIFTALTVHSL